MLNMLWCLDVELALRGLTPNSRHRNTLRVGHGNLTGQQWATAGMFADDYMQASVDISAYADGNTHTLRFEATSAATANSTSIYLEDIGIRTATDAVFLDGFEPQ